MKMPPGRGMRKDNLGQMGIGTLIVFIAMILVAAVAASVLMRVSGGLQTKAAATGEQAIEEVSTKIAVKALAGYSDAAGKSADKINKTIITVTLSAGSGEIKSSDIQLSYQSEDTYISGIYYNSSAQGETGNGAKDFYIQELKGNGDEVLERGEMMEIHFWIEDSAGEHALGTDSEVTLTVIPESGSPTQTRATTPGFIQYTYTSLL
jgi:flagellin-like protein